MGKHFHKRADPPVLAAMFDMESSLALDREFGLESIAVIFSGKLSKHPVCLLEVCFCSCIIASSI